MKVEDSKVCPECDEIYNGNTCPACGFGQGIPIRNTLMVLSPGRVRRVEKPHPEKIRDMPGGILEAIKSAGKKLEDMESLQ